MDTMTLTDNILQTLEGQEDETVDVLVLMPPEDEIEDSQQALEILLEATRVIRDTGRIVSDGILGAVLWVLADPNAEPDPTYVPFIEEVLAALGRDDLDPADLIGPKEAF